MKKIILSFVGTVIISAVFGVSTMFNDPKVEQPKEQLKQETKIEKVDEKTDTEEKAVENQDQKKQSEEKSSKTESNEKKETDSKSTNKPSSSVSNVPKQEATTKKESKSNSSNANTSQPTQSNSQSNQQNSSQGSQQSNQQNSQPQNNNSGQKNNVSTAFYDSITGGKKDRKKNGTPMTESECFALGTKIQNKELDYVLDYNEQHPEAPIQPDINYFRVYPVIDDEGTGYYLHFFCVSGEGNDAKLKSIYGSDS